MDSENRELRAALYVDTAFELIAGATLIVFATTLGDWLRIGTASSVVAGVVFVGAGIAIVALARSRPLSAPSVQALAWANTAGGAAGWVVLAATWGALDPTGRATLGIASDVFIALGCWELLALRRAEATSSTASDVM
jgi:hypothetical protein